MVYSHKQNLLFLRLPKNASTSLATWFIQNCCDHKDVWTGLHDSKIPPNNFPDSVLKKYKDGFRKVHLTLNELVDEAVISREKVMDSKIIGVVRNPYHRQLSLFFFKTRGRPQERTVENFRNLFENGYHDSDMNNRIVQSNYFKLGDDFSPNADPWRYEDIDKRLKDFIKTREIKNTHPLKKYKSSYKPKDMESLEIQYYDEATREAVYNYYKQDFELLERLK